MLMFSRRCPSAQMIVSTLRCNTRPAAEPTISSLKDLQHGARLQLPSCFWLVLNFRVPYPKYCNSRPLQSPSSAPWRTCCTAGTACWRSWRWSGARWRCPSWKSSTACCRYTTWV